MVMPLVAASALSLEVPDSVLRHSTHAALLNPISPRSVCPSGRSSARSEASPAAHRQPHTILNTRAGMVREVPRDTNKHDCGQSGRRELHHRAGSTIRQIGCVSDGSTEPPRSQHYDPTSHLMRHRNRLPRDEGNYAELRFVFAFSHRGRRAPSTGKNVCSYQRLCRRVIRRLT